MAVLPYCKLKGSIPTALQTLYRPPTQFQKPNTFSVSMPKEVARSVFALTATMCRRTMSLAGAPAARHIY